MFLWEVEGPFDGSVKKELPSNPNPSEGPTRRSKNLVVDPRPIPSHVIDRAVDNATFEITYHDNGTTVTITIIQMDVDVDGDDGEDDDDDGYVTYTYHGKLRFRVYDAAKETVPTNFHDSTTYTYMGVEGEKAPKGTIVVYIDPSVTIIRACAFSDLKTMKRCIFHDQVREIGLCAFQDCIALERILLSPLSSSSSSSSPTTTSALRRIGTSAFLRCISLDAVFVPSSVRMIEDGAFWHCKNMRLLSLPARQIPVEQMGYKVLDGCDAFFRATGIALPRITDEDDPEQLNRVNRTILNYYISDLPPLHQTCLDTNVTVEMIHECIRTHGPEAAYATAYGGMTPLHILVTNPYATATATGGAGIVLACFGANMGAVFVEDDVGMTPLDYLRKNDTTSSTSSTHHVYYALIQALCIHWVNIDNMGSRVIDAGDVEARHNPAAKRQKTMN